MYTYEQQLEDKIELYRSVMVKLAERKSMESGDVLKVSTLLDKLINEYQIYKLKKQQ